MSHLHGIGFENFKVFAEETYFEFAPLTILTGTNSSGKSSLINGLRLIADNFPDLGKSILDKASKNLKLDALMRAPLDISKIIERYGSLMHFVNNKSDQKEFKFIFKQYSPFLKEQLKFIYNIQIQENKLKTGRINAIEIISDQNESIFKISEGKSDLGISSQTFKIDENIFKINLSYFYSKFLQFLDGSFEYFQSINNLNKLARETDSETIIKEELDKHNRIFQDFYLLTTSADGMYSIFNYDYSPEGVITDIRLLKTLFENLQNKISPYNFCYLEDVSTLDPGFIQKLSTEEVQLKILETLSKVHWKAKSYSDPELVNTSPDSFLTFRGNIKYSELPFSLKRFVRLFVFDDYTAISMNDLETEVVNMANKSIIKAGLKHTEFIDNIFLPLVTELSKVFMPTFENLGRPQLEIEQPIETSFYDHFIFEILNSITSPFTTIKDFSFIDVQRVKPKRVFNIIGSDILSQQVKTLFESSDSLFEEGLSFLNKWIKEFQIADQIMLEKDSDTDIFKVYLKNQSGQEILLADYGFGTSQILPIIIAMIPKKSNDFYYHISHPFKVKLISIEEPENSLHPALQSKLADMFVEAITKFNVQLVIETHSEYLIRKLQYLTAKGELSSKATNIYYFFHPENIPPGEEQVKKIQISQDGSLSDDFGTGFFDEADKIAMSIWNMNQSQRN